MQTKLSFANYITEIAGTEDAVELSAILKSFNRISFRKNGFLVREGTVCNHFCYIESGILQHAIMVDGAEKTTYLALRNTVTTSLFSFLHQRLSRKDVKAIVDCVIWTIDLPTFQKLLQENNLFRKFYYQLLERQICLIDDYRIDLLTMTPEERYAKLLANEPNLLQQVPLRYLASFLGISDRHMSRIRSNVK
ncbi:Cyclic nucleotide-binding domain-containing protein [Flavobacterium longum]|uniref:Crp/Fnr family transcriptional regulator n=1 Tax=Flavobacterium longum TaxID=1299340 RepID=UPI0039E8DCCB